jgi:N-acetylglucosamine-6-phosphate deacetylase
LPERSEFALFGSDCVVEDGVCLLADHSALAGSAARMIDLVRIMVREVNVPLNEAVAMATHNPAGAIGLEKKGHLTVGSEADLVVISPQIEVVKTFAAGREIWSH